MPPQRLSGWKQFWVLLKFQAQNSPKVWRVPLYMVLIFFNDLMPFVLPSDTPFPSQTMIPNLSLLFLASLLLLSSQTPFFSRFSTKKYFPAAHQWMELSGGFLLTRAVDRTLIHRSMTLLMYPLVLCVPFTVLLLSFLHPSMRLFSFSRDDLQQYLHHLPGCTLIAPDRNYNQPEILVPHGRPLVAEWHLWAYLVGMLAVQLIYLIDQFKRLGWIRSVSVHVKNVFILLAEGTLLVVLISLLQNRSLFFAFLAHRTEFWLLMVPTMILGQLCCERLFARLEQG